MLSPVCRETVPWCFRHWEWRCTQPRVPSHQPWGRCQRSLPSCREMCCCTRLRSGSAGVARCESGNDTAPGETHHSSISRSLISAAFPSRSSSYQDVALVLVVVQGPVVNHVAGPSPGVGQQVLHKVLPLCKISHGSVFQHAPAFIVAVHWPHLREEEQRETGAESKNKLVRVVSEASVSSSESYTRILQGPNLGCFSGLVLTRQLENS